jgi:hypothetical protein
MRRSEVIALVGGAAAPDPFQAASLVPLPSARYCFAFGQHTSFRLESPLICRGDQR